MVSSKVRFEDGFGLLLGKKTRSDLWQSLCATLEAYTSDLQDLPLAVQGSLNTLRSELRDFDFANEHSPEKIFAWVRQQLYTRHMHSAHPSYYGVFNPNPATMAVLGDALVAAFNPQLASTASDPFCIEVEEHLLKFFAATFGFDPITADGQFTSGGSEANFTALLCALNARYPDFAKSGLQGINEKPLIYTSRETHHSFLKAARMCGLGSDSVIELPVTASLQFDVNALGDRLRGDVGKNHRPLMIIGTLGSTSAGVVDPLDALADLAEKVEAWFHVDAAWGGAALLLPEFASWKKACARAHSATLDAHKWLSMPMGAGIFITRDPEILGRSFAIDDSYYMPRASLADSAKEPYRRSPQWSRRAIGLKLFMTLAVHGEAGFRQVLRHQIRMGECLRKKLLASDWLVVNQTPLPVVCFRDPRLTELDAFKDLVNARGRTWITSTKLQFDQQTVLRAGISNFLTQEENLDLLIRELNEVRNVVL